jgi:hypothetical protein
VQDAIVAALAPQFVDIIDEDQDPPAPGTEPSANRTAYNTLGDLAGGSGKLAILALLNGTDCNPEVDGDQPCFLGRVLADNTLVPFFADVDAAGVARLVTCLERQIGAVTGGPEVYGEANGIVEGALLTDGALNQCRSMLETHVGLGITDAQFEQLDLYAAQTATDLGVPDPIIAALVAALTGEQMCRDIVEAAGEETACLTFDPGNDPDAP